MAERWEDILRPRAIAFLDSLSDDHARHVLDLIDVIKQDPEIDERDKIAFVMAPAIFGVYVGDPAYWIVYSHYRKDDQHLVSVVNIGYSSEGRPRA